MDERYNGNVSSDCTVKSSTLDQLYREQVTELRDLMLKKAEASDIEICRKWLKIFNCTTKKEKLARNCLCTLMQQQIKEFGCLSEPFTNLRNCNKDLECVLGELDNETQISTLSFRTESNAFTYRSHRGESSCDHHNNAEFLLGESPHIDFKAELMELKREVENLHLQLTEKQRENEKLIEMTEKCRAQTETKTEIIDNMKIKMLNCIRDKLLDLSNCGVTTKQLQLFESILQVHSNDLEFMELLRKYDLDLQQILSKHFECEITKYQMTMTSRICRKFLKKKSSLRQKYERRLTMQSLTQKLQLKLAKLKCISELRQIFIRSHKEYEKVELWEILNIFEEKYENVVNGL